VSTYPVKWTDRRMCESRITVPRASREPLIAVSTIVLLWRFKNLQEPVVIAAVATLGPVVYPLRLK
jgi:hypothetical protein